MLKEFKDFVMRGNVVDLAVAVILAGAFGKIVTSFVNDILMPPIGMLLGGVNFTDLFISLNGQTYESLEVAQAAGAPTINYGVFLTTIIDFIIVAFVIFMVVRAANRLQRQEEAPASPVPATRECPYCRSVIPKQATRCGHCTSDLAEK